MIMQGVDYIVPHKRSSPVFRQRDPAHVHPEQAGLAGHCIGVTN
jgi:hypothetical protein